MLKTLLSLLLLLQLLPVTLLPFGALLPLVLLLPPLAIGRDMSICSNVPSRGYQCCR
jgi:hypothetical protein